MVELSGGAAESTPGKNKFRGELATDYERTDLVLMLFPADSFRTKSISSAPVRRESTRIREAFFDESVLPHPDASGFLSFLIVPT